MRKHDRFLALLGVAAIVVVPAARAGSCPDSLGAAQQVVCLQQRNAVLQQRLSNAQIAQSLAKLGGGALSRNLGMPSVSAIFGEGADLRAMLTWTDATGEESGSLQVHAGDKLPGGLTVAAVLPGRVVLRDGARTHVLLMAGGSAGNAATRDGSMAGLPALPMGGAATNLPPLNAALAHVPGIAR